MTLEERHNALVKQGDKMFHRDMVDSLWQELAEQFYPERADFTATRSWGDDFASHLDSSYPIIARRDLGNNIGSMLRPRGKDWFFNRAMREDSADVDGRRWLEMTDRVQRRAISDRHSNFVRATKETDHDYATFGQGVISSEMAFTNEGPALLHRNWHLRDMAWKEDSYGRIYHKVRRWKPGAVELKNAFKSVHDAVTVACKKEPDKTFNVLHTMIRAENYDTYGKKIRQPWVSVFIDTDNNYLLSEKGSWTGYYVIPRWSTVSGSPYAYSPASIAALPDARLLQAQTYSLLTAGELAVEPPMMGVQEAIKGGVELFPGGFTAIDAKYDERLGDALKVLDLNHTNSVPVGLQLAQVTKEDLHKAFYLNALSLPPVGEGGMSPLEVSERINEFIRRALPLFEPLETEYNGALMEQDFEILMRAGAFGPPQNIPESLQGQETEFRFESPLTEGIDKIKGQVFMQSLQYQQAAATVDPIAAKMLKIPAALRDVFMGAGVPADWQTSDDELQAEQEKIDQQMQMAQMGQAAQVGADVMEKASGAAKNMSDAQQQEQMVPAE